MAAAGDVSGLLDVAVNYLDRKPKKSRQAFDALMELPDNALEALSAELDGDRKTRWVPAAYALSVMVERGNEAACEVACEIVRNPHDAEVAGVLLDSLSKWESARVVDAVVSFLEHPRSPLERPRRRREIVPPGPDNMTASQLLMLITMSDPRGSALVPAFEVLGEHREPRGTPLLVKGLLWNDPGVQAFEDELEAQHMLSHDLARVRNADSRVRCKAAWALGRIQSPEGRDALERALTDEDSDVRQAAAAALADYPSDT